MAGTAGSVLLVVGLVWLYFLWLYRRANGGVGWYKERRILKRGETATAKLLSCEYVSKGPTVSPKQRHYSIVYEVTPSVGETFRAKGAICLWWEEEDLYALQAGEVAEVRFDPSDRTVVMVPKRTVREAQLQKEADRKAREDALLRAGPDGRPR